VDETFPKRAKAAKEHGGGIIVGGVNYGQGSSREHAALAPVYLGVKAVICKSFARIHRQNLINNGIVPLTFAEESAESDYKKLNQGDMLQLQSIKKEIKAGTDVTLKSGNSEIKLKCELSERDREMILAGGLLNMFK
jgi:aconitate hydratase